MYGVELYAAVRPVVDEGLSHHEAGRRFGIDRRTVKMMLSYSATGIPPDVISRSWRRSSGHRHRRRILDTDPDVAQAAASDRRLRDEHGFTGGYTIVEGL